LARKLGGAELFTVRSRRNYRYHAAHYGRGGLSAPCVRCRRAAYVHVAGVPGCPGTFNDHIKMGDVTGLGDTGVTTGGTSAASNNSLAIMTGIDRNFPDPVGGAFPWKVRLRSSTDGANSFDSADWVIVPFASGAFLSDPTVSVSQSPSDLLHHT